MTAVPLRQAADALGIQPRTLARWLRCGAPAVRRGRRGRGGVALVDPQAIRAWRGEAPAGDHRDLEILAAEIPELIADAMLAAFQQETGPHKRMCAGTLGRAWYIATTALLDRVRRSAPGVADPDTRPPQIVALAAIYADLGTKGQD